MSGSHSVQSAAGRAADQAGSAGQDVVDTKSFGALVTVGLVAYGVVHLLVAWIVIQIAWTGSGTQASNKGAFQEMASTTVGDVILWITAVGLFALALWQVSQAILGHRDKQAGWSRVLARLGSTGRAIVYIALGVSAVTTAAGSGSGGNSEKSFTARLLSVPLGQALVVIVGVCIIAVGATMGYRGWKKKFTESLAGTVRTAVMRLGQVGYLTKGFAFLIVGVLFIVAGVTYDPQQAGGLDSAVRTLRQQPYGAWLLTVVAVGFVCFGLFCFAWSRQAKRA